MSNRNNSNPNNLRTNLNSIEKGVSDLLKKIDSPNDSMFSRQTNVDIRLNGYVDRADLYRNNLNLNEPSDKLKAANELLKEQSKGMKGVDNRRNLYPQSEINNEYKDLRKAVIDNHGSVPFLNASIRNTTLPYDILLSDEDKMKIQERGRRSETFQDDNRPKAPQKDPRDSRFNLYPNAEINNYKSERNLQMNNPSNGAPFENAYQRESTNIREIEGSNNETPFDHASTRDRVPMIPRDSYRSSYYQSIDKNQLDEEVTYDKNRRQVDSGQVNFPNGDVFTHGNARDRVPIDPVNVYRSSDYASTPYNRLDTDVDHVPQRAMINKTSDAILNREFDINNNNITSLGEENEDTMIHTPYTTLDKFNKPDVLFKNINESKPQVDVLNEFIVNIDSSNRNVTFYPNPFKLRVMFNPAYAGYTTDANGNKVANSVAADLTIPKAFENIKYLRLETATLPRYYLLTLTTATSATPGLGDANEQTILAAVITNINTNKATSTYNFAGYINSVGGSYSPPTGYVTQYVSYTWVSATNINAKFNVVNTSSVSIAYELVFNGTSAQTISNRYVVNTTSDLSTDRYLMINIDEITDNTQNSTNGKNQYNYLYPDYITTNYFYGDNHFVDKIFKNAKLGTIQTLTITLSDSFGNLITGGNYIDTTNSTTDMVSTTSTPGVTTVYNDSISYVRHPYYRPFQLTLMFKVGCYETEIDKKIFF
jgi:hypothetical protein